MGKIILTGDRPTGPLHVGHYVGSLKRRVELQNSGEYDKIFIMIAVSFRPPPIGGRVHDNAVICVAPADFPFHEFCRLVGNRPSR